MEYIPRQIDKFLLDWKDDRHRIPLLLRGARQVGKSSSVRKLGKTFKHFLEINLEKLTDARLIFESVTDVHEIAERLAVLANVPVIPGETLLFIDEIQISPDAIRMLRYFKEDFPELHVVAAGSLLEFALANLSSFGVGRITSLFMYPFSFKEFLLAMGKGRWVDAIESAGPADPVFESLHNNLVEEFRSFLHVGGMPAS
ncbi:MAG: AAA family ATPase, partial [Muribaculaceae bacterium]|nr:AAA family ATPase [Muribaculaceae bacterium]